jgi:hypothetical protein
LQMLKDYLTRILTSREFLVEEQEGYLYGRRDDTSIVVMIGGDMLLEEVQDFVRNMRQFPGRKVVASLGKPDEAAQEFLQKHGVHYWGREELEHEIGNLHLETLTDGRGHSLVDEVVSDDVPQRLSEPPEQSIPIIVESAVAKAEQIVKPNFLLEDVKHLARHDIQGYKYELELVPHYLFHFVMGLSGGRQRAGIVAVNALTEQAETWRWGFELVESIDLPHFRREPKVDHERAKAVAQEVIAREHRAHVETVRDFGHAEIIERAGPKKDTVLIEPKGLVYLPVWCVEGRGGAMIVNSSSGKIITEHLHQNESRRG